MKINHQQGAQPYDFIQGNYFFLGENIKYHQTCNGYFEIDKTLRINGGDFLEILLRLMLLNLIVWQKMLLLTRFAWQQSHWPAANRLSRRKIVAMFQQF